MAWFKVDDGLHDHRKTRKVRRSHPDKRRDVAPFGLWVLAGSWAGANDTSGFVPTEILEEWDDDALELARRLVDAGLWWPTVEDGEPGFGFHDWEDRNPVNEVDSGRFGNHLRWHVNRGVNNPDCTFCLSGSSQDAMSNSSQDVAESRDGDTPDSPQSIAPNRPDDRPESGTTSPPESSPVPTRPDPTDKKPPDDPPAFVEFWGAYPRRIDKGHARRAWRSKVIKAKVDPAVVIEAASRFAAKVASSDPKFIAHPSTWLNGERWLDEEAATRTIDDDNAWMRRRPTGPVTRP